MSDNEHSEDSSISESTSDTTQTNQDKITEQDQSTSVEMDTPKATKAAGSENVEEEQDEVDPVEKEKIEEDLKNMAKEFESKEDEAPKPELVRLMITFSIILGPIFSLILFLSDGFLSSIRSFVEPLSYGISIIFLVYLLIESFKKSR